MRTYATLDEATDRVLLPAITVEITDPTASYRTNAEVFYDVAAIAADLFTATPDGWVVAVGPAEPVRNLEDTDSEWETVWAEYVADRTTAILATINEHLR